MTTVRGLTVLALICSAGSLAYGGPGDRTVQLLCGQTSHFRVGDGSGGLVPFVSTSSFLLDVTFTDAGPAAKPSRKGYQYYKAQSDLASSAAHNNPLYQGSGTSGENPLIRSRTIIVRPINDPPSFATESGFYSGWSDATGHYDLWDGMPLRVQFFDDAGVVSASFVAEGEIELTGEVPGSNFLPGDQQTFTFKTGTGPLKWMAPEAIRRDPASPPLPELWLEEITFTTTVVPAPGAGVAAALGLLAACGRRRR